MRILIKDVIAGIKEYERLKKVNKYLDWLRQNYYDKLKSDDFSINQDDDIYYFLGVDISRLIEAKMKVVRKKMNELEVIYGKTDPKI